jgi:tetratricopeptide (TPR) repeat protein
LCFQAKRKTTFLKNYLRAELHRLRGDYPQALSDGDRAIVLNPQSTGAYLRRGITYTELGDIASALADFDRTIGLD